MQRKRDQRSPFPYDHPPRSSGSSSGSEDGGRPRARRKNSTGKNGAARRNNSTGTNGAGRDPAAAGQAKFQQYRKGRLLGEGAFKKVYVLVGDDKHVWMQGKRHVSNIRLREEAETMDKFEHPNILKCIDAGVDAGEEGGRFFIITERYHCDLSHMSKRMAGDKTLTYRIVYIWATQIASAIQHVHDKRMAHRDIKPGNILIGQHNRVILADFGLSKLVPSDDKNVGTPGFMAPEIYGSEHGKKVDIFAFGMTFFEILTGVVPFGEFTPQEVKQIMRSSKDSVSPPELECITHTCWNAFIKHCLKVDPCARPSAPEVYEKCCEVLLAKQEELNDLVVHLPPDRHEDLVVHLPPEEKRSQSLPGAKRRKPG
jgi:serine/threonine protein kinase